MTSVFCKGGVRFAKETYENRKNALPQPWKRFLTGGTKAYQEIADAFKIDQPELWHLLKQQDEEWFSAKTDHVGIC
jgi:hypothetical protein